MSYTLLVQSDNPIGYWKLNGTTTDLSLYDNSASMGAGTKYSALPLVANSGSSTIIGPSSGSIVIAHTYDAFSKGLKKAQFGIEFWISFNSSVMDGNGYFKNSSSTTSYFTNNELKIMRLMNGATEVAYISYDYNKNSFKFDVNDPNSKNIEAEYVVRNLNTSFHIFAFMSESTLNITVNGESGISGVVNDSSLYTARGTNGYKWVIDYSSFNSSASMSYVINDLAFYDYMIPLSSMRKRIVWAYHNDKPSYLTNTQTTSFFDIEELDNHVAYHNEIMGGDFHTYKELFNLEVNDNEGLRYITTASPVLDVSLSSSAALSYTVDGVTMSNYAAILISDYNNLLKSKKTYTFTSQIKYNGGSNYIFSLNDNLNRAIYYATAESNGFHFYQYSIDSSLSTEIVSATSTLSSGSSYNFGLSITNGYIYIYGNSVSNSSSISMPSITSETTLNIGNMVAIPNTSNSMNIKNFGFSNIDTIDFSTVDFTQNQMFMCKLTNDLTMSQIGYWIRPLNLGTFGNSLVGSKVTWDGMDNVSVSISNNNGFTWNDITRGTAIPNMIFSDVNKDCLIKVIVPYSYLPKTKNQSFNNLYISLYNNLVFNSNDKNYELIAKTDSSSYNSFTIQRNNQAMGFRKDNFGIKFDPISSSSTYVAGYAEIISNTTAINNYGVDFWFKANSITTASSYLIHLDYISDVYLSTYTDLYSGSLTATEFYLYVDQSTNRLIYSPPAARVYLNGASVSSNSTSITIGDYYHIGIDYGSASGYESHSVMTLNGLYETASSHSAFVYGNINIWNKTLSASIALARYQSFVANSSSIVTDISSTVWQSNWASNAITTASGFKIGT